MFNQVKTWLSKTGGKYIIADENSNPLYVIMTAKEYEKFINKKQDTQNLSRQELMKKINHDIDIWKSSQIKDQEQSMVCDEELEQKSLESDNFIVEEIVDPELSEEIIEKLAKF